VGEPLSWLIAILDGGEHGAEEKHQSIGILMMRSSTVLNQFQRIPADMLHGTAALKCKTLRALHRESNIGLTNIIKTELIIK
jgi:hypothetical protein